MALVPTTSNYRNFFFTSWFPPFPLSATFMAGTKEPESKEGFGPFVFLTISVRDGFGYTVKGQLTD